MKGEAGSQQYTAKQETEQETTAGEGTGFQEHEQEGSVRGRPRLEWHWHWSIKNSVSGGGGVRLERSGPGTDPLLPLSGFRVSSPPGPA